MPLLTDFYGFSMGALGEKGALYGSPPSEDAPSMLVYRCGGAQVVRVLCVRWLHRRTGCAHALVRWMCRHAGGALVCYHCC